METIIDKKIACYHCGEICTGEKIKEGDKVFCCPGCRMVYQLLNGKGLCDYYQLNEKPGINRRTVIRQDKFAFLDDEKIQSGLITFCNEEETHVTLYLPQIHCSSCLYLLEHLHKLEQGVIDSRVDFAAREISVVFNPSVYSLRALAELLTSLGYEPYISLRDLGHAPPVVKKSMIYQLGIAGFCFANIMLLSFPEYLGLEKSERLFQQVFRYLNLLLSLPVLLYSAQPFYISAWNGFRHKFLNIDAPIVLAIAVTFTRSLGEVLSGTGAGYFDSMTGIIFFMLAGRVLQNRTNRRLSFDRDYTSYFPVAVTVLQPDKDASPVMELRPGMSSGQQTGSRSGQEVTKSLSDIRCGDELLIHHEEIIPADGILTRGKALIDYSFVTGESVPVPKEVGALVYAGGRQTGAAIEILVVKEVAQSYLTQLWNRQGNGKDRATDPNDVQGMGSENLPQKEASFVHLLSRYFTYIVFSIAALAALYWWAHDPVKIAGAVTAVLIIACPCALLLSSTFTNGNILRILGRHHFYLRNAQVIESIATTTHIVFDKTGTLTDTSRQQLVYEGIPLTLEERRSIATLAAQSTHPLSRALAVSSAEDGSCQLKGFREVPGEGIEGFINGKLTAIGSSTFIERSLSIKRSTASSGQPVGHGKRPEETFGPGTSGTRVYVGQGERLLGYYTVSGHYREGIPSLMQQLKAQFRLSLLSGDNAWERPRLIQLLGAEASLLFSQAPKNKTRYILQLQRRGEKVMMVGDGLNDAGALQRSNTGIALSENCNNFTPASDAILESGKLPLLPKFIRLCRINRKIILASFALSILYNIIGLTFAVQGDLSPLVAAILMPSSSLSILLITYGSSNLAARQLGLGEG